MGLIILSGNAAASLLLLLRNLAIAKLISVEDYGVAATFAVVMALVEMASTFGLQQQIIQSKSGDDPRFQSALQGFQVLRGVIAGVFLYFLAEPVARFLGIPEVAWAYQLLAIVPVIKSFEHFDIHRLNRQLKFLPLLSTGALPALVSLLAIWPLAVWVGDWRVMLYSILIQGILGVITSHIFAERGYRLSIDTAILREAVSFGWPILVNSALLFLVFQADKLIVGRFLGMEMLAMFAMGMTLSLTPTMVIAKTAQNFYLPQLSTASESRKYAEIAVNCLSVISLSALAFAMVLYLLGGPFVELLFGEKFAHLVPLIIWFGLGQALRVIKAGPAIVALSAGNTSNAMLANVLRVIALPLIWVTAENGGSLVDVLGIVVVAEALSVLVAFALLARTSALTIAQIFVPQIPSVVLLIAFGFWAGIHAPEQGLAEPLVWAVPILMLVAALLLTFFCRKYVLNRKNRDET